jgi:hypothetical protein
VPITGRAGDYIDTDEVPPGGCRGQGRFGTWDLSRLSKGAITPLGTWETELNGMFVERKIPQAREQRRPKGG